MQCLGRGCTPTLIRSNKALMCLEAGRERGQGPERDPAAGRHPPERPLSPPQGQRWPTRAPLPFTPTAAGAPRHQHQRRCPGPRRRPPAAGSGTGHGAAGVRVPPPARPPPPTPSAHPVPWPGPHLPPSPCRGTPASTASRLRRYRLPPSLRRPRPAPAPAPRPFAGPAAGTSSARPPAFLFTCNSSLGRAAATQEMLWPLGPQYWLPPPKGKGPGIPICRFPFDWMGEMKGNTPQKTTENRIIDYLFVFNLFCHIFVKRQKCNKKYISTVPGDGAVELGLRRPSDLRLVLARGA